MKETSAIKSVRHRFDWKRVPPPSKENNNCYWFFSCFSIKLETHILRQSLAGHKSCRFPAERSLYNWRKHCWARNVAEMLRQNVLESFWLSCPNSFKIEKLRDYVGTLFLNAFDINYKDFRSHRLTSRLSSAILKFPMFRKEKCQITAY